MAQGQPATLRKSDGLPPEVAAILGHGPPVASDPTAAQTLKNQGAYFTLFSLPNPASPSTGVPLLSFLPPLAIGFDVSEELHRFVVDERPPTAACGLRIRQDYDPAGVARVSMKMTPMANNFQAGPGRVPWPTVLLPFLSQRFTPLDGSFAFLDEEQSGFQAVGAGRIFPTPGLQPRLVAVLDIVEATGKLKGLTGTGIVNGDIAPPSGFAFSVLFRLVDPSGTLKAQVPPGPLVDASDPTPETPEATGTSFLSFLSEPDPERPIQTTIDASGQHATLRIFERLRLVHTNFNVNAPGLRTATETGAIVGTHSTTLSLDLSTAASGVIPAFSQGDDFAFFDRDGRSVGGFRADTREARLFPTTAPGSPPMLRIGGFAEPTSGTGQFQNPIGMVSINGAISPATGAVSTFYMVRLSAPDAVYKALQ